MSCIHISACQLACTPPAVPNQPFQLRKAYTCKLTYLRKIFPKISLETTSATSRYQLGATVCLFGDKGKSENGDETSPWKALEEAAANLQKNQPVEDVLKQLLEKQGYFDDKGSNLEGPGDGDGPGGGGGGGDGSGSNSGTPNNEEGWGEIMQMTLATCSFILLYIYILNAPEVNVYTKDILKYIFIKKMSFRLRGLVGMLKWNWREFNRIRRVNKNIDPYWLEREILRTRTAYDSPAKYKMIRNAYIEAMAKSKR